MNALPTTAATSAVCSRKINLSWSATTFWVIRHEAAATAARTKRITAERGRSGQRFTRLLAGFRGSAPVDLAAVVAAIAAFSVLVTDLGDHLQAFDVNPLICTPDGVVAVDALAVAV